MDEQTTNNIIKQKEEEDISRWEIEQLENDPQKHKTCSKYEDIQKTI